MYVTVRSHYPPHRGPSARSRRVGTRYIVLVYCNEFRWICGFTKLAPQVTSLKLGEHLRDGHVYRLYVRGWVRVRVALSASSGLL